MSANILRSSDICLMIFSAGEKFRYLNGMSVSWRSATYLMWEVFWYRAMVSILWSLSSSRVVSDVATFIVPRFESGVRVASVRPASVVDGGVLGVPGVPGMPASVVVIRVLGVPGVTVGTSLVVVGVTNGF